MLTVPGRASRAQIMKSTESSKGTVTAATKLKGGDAEDAGNSDTIVTMRGGGDIRPRGHRRGRATPDARARDLETNWRVAPSQRQSDSAQQTPRTHG